MKKIIIILILNLMTLVIVNLVVAQQKSPISPSTLTKRMFGWHHMDFPDVVSNYHWESISDLSWLGYLVDPLTGNPKDQNNAEKVANWSIDPAVLAAKNHNVRINLCVGFEPSSGIPTFISNPNPSARSNLREKIIAAVVAANADGVNINFENEAIFTTDDNLQRFHSFIEEVENGIGPNRELSITLIPSWCTLSNFTTFINLLNDNIDLFILMGYNYHWPSNINCGPVAPLYSFNGENLSVSYHINKFLNSGIAANTFLLGIPYFGINWPTVQPTDCSNIMSGTAPGENFDYWYYKSNTSGYFNTLYRDPNTFDPFFCYPDASTVWHKAFIDDVESYQKKYDLVKQRGIAGIAVWRLGQDDGYDDLWNLININLSSNNIEQPFGTIYDMGGPNGDYHTSEEYYFTISPPGAFTVTLTFDSFNLENGPDYIKIFNGPSISSPQIGNILTGNSIPSPVTANSGAMTIQFHSDGTINRPGFIANYTSVQLPPIIILNAQFNKSVYIPFEDVTLTVTLSDQLVGASVSFTVDNSVPINCPGIGNGVYEQTFPAPSTPGTHNVVVNASKTGFINATPYQTSFIVSNPTSLYLGIVTPPQGNTTTNFLFSVYFKDFQAPQYVKTIGSGWSINMTPNGSNYTEGVQFTGNKTFSTPGTYTYHYEAKTSTGEIIYFPATGNLTLNVTQSAEGWDLAVLSFGTFYSPTDVLPGTNISVTANIKNQSITGNTYTNVPLKASLLNSSGSLIAEYSTTIANLISGQSNTYNLLLTMPLNSPDGNYQIVVQVFPPQDNDPTNNSISLGLYMGPSLSNEQFEVPAGSEYIEKNNHVHIPPESPNEFKLTGGNTNGNSAIFQAPDGNLITIYEEHLELFNSYNAGIALEYFGGGPTIYYAMIKPGHSVTTGPDFPIKLIACNPGQVITFNATASNGMHFISNQEHDYPIFVTGNNTKHTNIVKTWLTDVVRANGYTTISFQFTIPSSAVTGTYKFYMTTAYSNSSIEHMTRLKIKVDPFLPHINSLDKYSFSADDLLTISGTNFGTLSGTVKFTTNLSGQIYSWSNTQIKCYVPEEIQNGVVTVANSVGTSNGIGYQVISYTGDPVVVQPIPDQSMNQNSSLVAATLTNVFWDPNNDALIFSAISSSPDITISILNGILTLTTNNNATSSAQITVSATDADNITVRDFFTITVLQIPPYPPSTLNATAVSVNQIDLSWENVSNEDGYHIYRAPTINGTFSILTSVGANVSNYADLGLSENTQFCYKITAYNSGGNSGDSPISCATTFGNQLPPVAPSFISATTVSSSQIDITWDAVPNADGYKLWSPHIGWLQVVWEIILGSDVTSYSHMELPDETEVCYYVQAFNSSGNSPDTGPACATTLNAIPIITTSVSSLPSFGEVPVGTSSAPQSYMVSGTNLTSNISITAPPGFEISLTSNSGYTNSISLIKSGGTVSPTTMYTRFSPTNNTTYMANISHTSNGAITKLVSVSGVGTMNACAGLNTVIYGGMTYNTILIGSQCWLKENLNIGTKIPGTQDQTNDNNIEKYCYNNSESNCDVYGGLYQWAEMVQYLNGASNTTSWNPVPTGNIQGICPSGWHIPTDAEWKILEGTVDSQYGVGNPIWDQFENRGYDAGQRMKSDIGWNGTNIFGFSAVPSGGRQGNGSFAYLGTMEDFWTSTEGGTNIGYGRHLNSYVYSIRRYNYGGKIAGYSVRCLKDETPYTPANQLLQNIILPNGQTNCYDATQTITIAGNGTTFTVENGASATLIAGQKIDILPATHVFSGGYLHGYIATNGQYCGTKAPAMPAVVTGEIERPVIIENSFFKVYPNPTTGNFILELTGNILTNQVKVDIYGIWGEKVSSVILTSERKHEFSLSDRPAGVYFIRVISGTSAETVKIIKQ